MIKSMTGYGKSRIVLPDKEITAEIRSVNNRYLDFSVKAPKFLSFAEEKIKALAGTYVSRGKAEVFITVITGENSGKKISIDEELALSYITEFKKLCENNDIEFNIKASNLINTEAVKIVREEQTDEELWAELEPVLKECFESYNEMRAREGERLKNDIVKKIENISEYVKQLEEIFPENIAAYKDRLYNKIKETLENAVMIDESRILTEVSIYSDKVCVDEETVRLKSHLTELKKLLDADGSVGKKADFIIQEMNREINTVGSKSNDIRMTSIVIEVKNEIEKIREQIQNIE